MEVHVYDKDIGSKDDYLGKCKISTNVIRTAMTSGQLQDVWKLLEDVKRGSIHLEIGWCDLKLNPSMPKKLFIHNHLVFATRTTRTRKILFNFISRYHCTQNKNCLHKVIIKSNKHT